MTTETNQSAALAAMVAFLVMPQRLQSFQRAAEQRVREQTHVSVLVQRTVAQSYADLENR